MYAQRMLNLRYWVSISWNCAVADSRCDAWTPQHPDDMAQLSPVSGQHCFTAISYAQEIAMRIGLAVMGIGTDKICPACGTAGVFADIPGCYARDPRGMH